MGCHPDQAKEFNESAKARGLTGVYYNENGQCELSSRGQRAKELDSRGFHDNDGGYGD